MGIRRISFIEAGAPGLHVFSKFTIARVGTVLLSTILKEKGFEVKTFIEDISEPDWAFIENSDLVCISTLTSTAIRAYEIGEKLKSKGIPVIMGGAHPTFMPEEALQYLETLPIPDFSLVHDWKSSTVYPVSTSRGCPFNCTFCSVIRMFGRKYRFKSTETILKELKYISSVSTATRFFVDDNFTANKQQTKKLLREMIAERLSSTWSAQVRTDVAADTELLRLMADSGCHTVYIGFESINPKTLEEYNKKQALEDIVNCVKTVKEHGLHIHGMFVLGADAEDFFTQTGANTLVSMWSSDPYR